MEQTKEFSFLLNRAYFFLRFRPRSKKEIMLYLAKKVKVKAWSEKLIGMVVQRLEEEKLVNDREFINWLAQSRLAYKPKSSWALGRELRRFGVADELIEEYFMLHPVNDQEKASQLLELCWFRFVNLPEPRRFQKAMGLLVRRGFNFSMAREAYKNTVAFAKTKKSE